MFDYKLKFFVVVQVFFFSFRLNCQEQIFFTLKAEICLIDNVYRRTMYIKLSLMIVIKFLIELQNIFITVFLVFGHAQSNGEILSDISKNKNLLTEYFLIKTFNFFYI